MYILTLNKLQFLALNIIVIFLFGLIYKHYGNDKHFIFLNKNKHMNFTDALYFSANTYITIGNNDTYPKTKFMKKIIMIQMLILIVSLIMLSSYDKLLKL
jgi:hypothetical protein